MRAAVIALLAASLLSDAAAAERRTIEVGPDRALKTPSAAAAIARDGDRIRIDAGEYRDCAVWRADDLLIEGVGGRAHVRDVTCANQAIWLVLGNRFAVRDVEFSGAHATFNNGAGIKFMAATLTVSDCHFHHNENGILTGPNPESVITIVGSRFNDNGRCEPHCAHGVYIGLAQRLTVVRSVFQNQRIAHHIKSRARFSEIADNVIVDGEYGTASYAVDLSNGGTGFILRNSIHKGPLSDNTSASIAIAPEGASNPGHGVYIHGNSFRNDNPKLEAFVRSFVPGLRVELSENRFRGAPAVPLRVAPREPKD
jgi:hypothetical protein